MTSPEDGKEFDLESIVPDLLAASDPFEREVLELHLARYQFATRFVSGRRVLDLACGAGYGSALLAEAGATVVVGVDRSPETILYARSRYARPGVEFVEADAMAFAHPEPFDVAVSLETIEHLPDPESFVARLVAAVRPGGHVVASVPTTYSTDVNPFHLHDFTPRTFRRLLVASGLELGEEFEQRQPFSPWRLARGSKTSHRDYGLKRRLPAVYLRRPWLLARRLWTVARFGFENRYLVVVGRRPDPLLPEVVAARDDLGK